MRKIDLAIRGGGVKVTAIGVLKAFEEEGIKATTFSGSSMSAIIATLAALGTPADEILYLFKKFVVVYSKANRLEGGKGSCIIEETVNEQCGYKTFKDVDRPLFIVANQGGLWDTKLFLFSKETTPNVTLGEACRASSSFPIAYERYKLKIGSETKKFYDGGMARNPWIPEGSNNLSVLCTFRKNKVNLKSRYKEAWMIPEEQADFIIQPYVGKMGTFGTPDDIQLAATLGYIEAKKRMAELMEC